MKVRFVQVLNQVSSKTDLLKQLRAGLEHYVESPVYGVTKLGDSEDGYRGVRPEYRFVPSGPAQSLSNARLDERLEPRTVVRT